MAAERRFVRDREDRSGNAERAQRGHCARKHFLAPDENGVSTPWK